MTGISSSFPRIHYGDYSDFRFSTSVTEGLLVEGVTDNLYLRSVRKSDHNNLVTLFSDEGAVASFQDGQPKSEEYVAKRINTWIGRRMKQDPFHGLVVMSNSQGRGKFAYSFSYVDKKAEVTPETFYGVVVMGHDAHPGEVSLAGIEHSTFHRRGYGTQAIYAIRDLANALYQQRVFLNGKRFCVINATAMDDNKASIKLLQKLGMKQGKAIEIYSQKPRHVYSLTLNADQTKVAQQAERHSCLIL